MTALELRGVSPYPVNETSIKEVKRVLSKEALAAHYKKIFGKFCGEEQPVKIKAQLICWAEEQPTAGVDHNCYKKPAGRLERWKWLAGVENSLDKEVQANYSAYLVTLENTKAESIIQLHNQMKAFWHADRQIKDYVQFSSIEKIEAKKRSVISRIFFECMRFLLRFFYKPSIVVLGKKLEDRARETFAIIGGFKLNEKEYDVVAYHILGDEQSTEQYKSDRDETHLQFNSISYGKTYVGIFEKQGPHSLQSLGRYGGNHNFKVLIGREKMDESILNLSAEDRIDHVTAAVTNSKRHLLVEEHLEYRDGNRNPQGSDRMLDQKLTQIMIEMAMQNSVLTVQASSGHDDLPVLAASGFDSYGFEDVLKEVNGFRSNEANKLFPPYKNYGRVSTKFRMVNINDKIVHYSRSSPESWIEIINKQTILRPKAAVLPEFWARKPNVVK